MPDHALLDQLLNSFPKSNKEDWSHAASREISGKNPLKHLTWKSDDEINFLPYYDSDDIASLRYLKHFQRTSDNWLSLPKISLSANKNANASNKNVNAVALNHLANGADGILFDIDESQAPDLDLLLSEIHWPSCNVSFLVTHLPNLIQHITQYTSKKKYDPGLLTGTIFCKSRRDIHSDDLKETQPYKELRTLGIYIPSSSAVREISSALIHATKLMDSYTDSGYARDLIWRNLGFSIASSKNFLLDIAKQKALRLLLYQVGRAFELMTNNDVHINIRVEPWTDEKFQPHGSMISGTLAALAAVVSGCDSLTVVPEDENNATMARISRNVCNILREESHLTKVADPTAGAYAVESVVNELSIAAWRDFQHNVKLL